MLKDVSVADEWPVPLRINISHLGHPVRIGGSGDTAVVLHEQSTQSWKAEPHA